MTKDAAVETLKAMFSGDWEDDKAVAEFFDKDAAVVEGKVKDAKAAAVAAKIEALKKELESM